MSNELSPEEHQKRHIELHKAFDELIADFIAQTGKVPSETTIMELMAWSHTQTINPTHSEV